MTPFQELLGRFETFVNHVFLTFGPPVLRSRLPFYRLLWNKRPDLLLPDSVLLLVDELEYPT